MEDQKIVELAERLSDNDLKRIIEYIGIDRQREILGAFDLLTMHGIGKRVGLTYYSIKAMRVARLGDPTGFPHPRKLPPSIDIKEGGVVFLGKEINAWALQSGRKIYT